MEICEIPCTSNVDYKSFNNDICSVVYVGETATFVELFK